MSTKLDVTRHGDPRNALLLGEACSLAYLAGPAAAKGFRETLGLDARLIAAENTQVYVAQSPEVVLVAFRGSECPTSLDGFKDWLLTNANNYLILPEGRIGTDFVAAGVGARFHRGFMAALDAIWSPLFAAVDEALRQAERPLWVTGHSLGGALALLAAWRFERNFLAVDEVVTFGAPMIGNDAAASAFEERFAKKISRYVNLEDPVPLLPSVSLLTNTYVHCPTEVPLADDPSAASALDALKRQAGAAAGAVLDASLVDEVWNAVQGRIAAHFIDRYLDRIRKQIGETA
ncbi:lipase family protein [Planctomyces sp. SH-PL62]|uniref:lipase family protein n=1 Tax=Planctomyces sp. SH-PL62 TaxID=1636152 RepID=UPI00078C6C95|nr:lipase family protein [Planctomyces sp. SH-PL62]AMV37905.1 Lipase (class 3) [Planctomyces sp. SH-PL62]